VDKVVGMEYKHFKSLRLMRSEPGLQKTLGTREKFQQLSGNGRRGRMLCHLPKAASRVLQTKFKNLSPGTETKER